MKKNEEEVKLELQKEFEELCNRFATWRKDFSEDREIIIVVRLTDKESGKRCIFSGIKGDESEIEAMLLRMMDIDEQMKRIFMVASGATALMKLTDSLSDSTNNEEEDDEDEVEEGEIEEEEGGEK